jgi:hypothetical protein
VSRFDDDALDEDALEDDELDDDPQASAWAEVRADKVSEPKRSDPLLLAAGGGGPGGGPGGWP